MLWDLYQQHQIHTAQDRANSARSKADQVANRIRDLESKIDSLALTCQAIWELARDRAGLTEEELLAKVEEIDLRDGVRDGKITTTAQNCKQCGRKTSSRRSRCLYCGAEANPENPFVN